jgi:gluconate:H+ symporter, GntP family
MYLIILLVVAVAMIIVLSTKLQVHPFLALILAGLFFGTLSGMPLNSIVGSINDGFGQTLGKIGMVIVLGVIIGEFLEKSGGAFALAESMLTLIGRKNVTAVMSVIGWIVSIPVFADSGFIILTPLNRSLTKRAGLSFATTSLALVLGLVCTHTMVPPTPGPIAAAGILNANLGLVLLVGLPVSFVAMIVSWFYTIKVSSNLYIDPAPELNEADVQKLIQNAPGSFKSSLPIFVPILLIVLKSLVDYKGSSLASTSFGQILQFIGEPVIALLIGLALALLLPKKLKKVELSTTGWTGKALMDSAVIILITGAGGAFGKVLQNSGIADSLSTSLSQWPLGLWLPFILTAALKCAQGSSTVAIITTASILSPMMGQLGFESEISKALVVVAIGAGSAVVSHVNDSLFWIFTQSTGMNLNTALKKYTPGTLCVGLTAILLLNLIYFFIH